MLCPSSKRRCLSNGVVTRLLADFPRGTLGLPLPPSTRPSTNQKEIIFPIGLKGLVKPEGLSLDSAQHRPGAKSNSQQAAHTSSQHATSEFHPRDAPCPRVRGFGVPTPWLSGFPLRGCRVLRSLAVGVPTPWPSGPPLPGRAGLASPQPLRPGCFCPPRPVAPHHWRSLLVVSRALRNGKVF